MYKNETVINFTWMLWKLRKFKVFSYAKSRSYKLWNSCFPSAKLGTLQHWPSICKNVAEDQLPIWCRCWNDNSGSHLAANLAQILATNTCFWQSNGPMLCRTLVLSLPEWFAVVKMTLGRVICRPWAGLWLFYFQN